MNRSNIVERTHEYVVDNFRYARRDVDLRDDEHLFDRGIVDSLGVAEMVSFLEAEFAIRVADEDVTEKHFCSVCAIADYVLAKQLAPGST
jgi:acyl carrier protein